MELVDELDACMANCCAEIENKDSTIRERSW